MMRIDFTAPLIVTDEDDAEVADWDVLRPLAGRSFENTDVLGYFGQSPEELPVAVLLNRLGDIRILANDHDTGLLARSSLRAARRLTPEELEVLRGHVEATWSDGVGENLDLDEFMFHIDLDHIECQQVDDGVISHGSGTRDLFPAIHAADIDRVQAALQAGENVQAVLGGTTTLGWAIAYANAAIARLLIDAGVNVHYQEHEMHTVLVSCAASRDFADEDAVDVAGRLLDIGGFDRAEVDRAIGVAELRQKTMLLQVLREHAG